MKTISIVIPTYNEEANVVPLSEALIEMLSSKLPQYDYEILFIDNHSQDKTQQLLTGLCENNPKIKAIFNAKNFGQFNSPFYGMLQAKGDCVIAVCADFQDPIDLVPTFVKEWENGYQIVSGIKTTSKENRLVYKLRTLYYKTIKKFSDVEQIEHFTGFGLYDRSFIETLRSLKDPQPFLRGIVAELGGKRKDIPYEQARRRAGKTKNNWYSLYDAAMLSFTTYTKIGLRLATFTGFAIAFVSIVIALVYLILKLAMWNEFSAGTAPIMIGMFFLGAVQLIFIGFIGEYILSINNRLLNRPLVVEEKRLNFEKTQTK